MLQYLTVTSYTVTWPYSSHLFLRDSWLQLLILWQETNLQLYILRVFVAAVHSAIFRSQSTHQHNFTYCRSNAQCSVWNLYDIFTSVAHMVLHAVVNETCQKARRAWRNGKVLSQCFQIHTVYLPFSQCTLTWSGFQAPAFVIYCTYVSVSMQGKRHAKIKSAGKPPPDSYGFLFGNKGWVLGSGKVLFLNVAQTVCGRLLSRVHYLHVHVPQTGC